MCCEPQSHICRGRILHRLCASYRSADTQRDETEVLCDALPSITSTLADDLSLQQDSGADSQASLVPTQCNDDGGIK